jgi:acyl-CoA reductase-like NAD-dependent aldehyde dehydrogenase
MASVAPRSIDKPDEYRLLIAGALESSGQWLEVVNPATGKAFIRVPRATLVQLERAIKAAKLAFVSWSRTPMKERRERLLRVADRIQENVDRIATLLTREQGKTLEAARQEA